MKHDYKSGVLFSDVTGFVSIIKSIIDNRHLATRQNLIQELLTDKDLFSVYINADNGRQIFKHEYTIILDHELSTAKKLTEVSFDVIFAPKGMFKRGQKRFDIYAVHKDGNLIKADLKANFEPTKNSIFNSIKSGGKQAGHIVLEIKSAIQIEDLISGLKEGCRDEKNVKTIMLFYKKRFFNLDRNTILSKRIYKLLK